MYRRKMFGDLDIGYGVMCRNVFMVAGYDLGKVLGWKKAVSVRLG